jgi:eukaryotic-like serine/threonine-protein kinase
MKTQRQYWFSWLLLASCFVMISLACSRGSDKAMEGTVQAEDSLVVVGTVEAGLTQVALQDGMVMVNVPGGEFLMGAKVSEKRATDEERPLHIVLVDNFWIDRTEVSNAMFATFIEESGYQTDAEKAGWGYVWTKDGRTEAAGADWMHPQGQDSSLDGLEEYPVMLVSWNDATAYCTWVGRRLPSEAEWEKAARGIDGRFYPWGEEFDSSFANVDDEEVFDEYMVDCSASGCDGYAKSSPVGSFEAGASPYGVLDMAGNLWEWTADYYERFYYTKASSNNPQGPAEGDRHVLRGGSWLNSDYDISTTYRAGNIPDYRSDKLGFRCVVSEFL